MDPFIGDTFLWSAPATDILVDKALQTGHHEMTSDWDFVFSSSVSVIIVKFLFSRQPFIIVILSLFPELGRNKENTVKGLKIRKIYLSKPTKE